MKKTLLVAICILTLCMLTFADTASAYIDTHVCYVQASGNTTTIDGNFTSSSEWVDGWETTFGNATATTSAAFRDKYYVVSTSPITVNYYMIIETNDTTNDAGDYWQICFDTNETATTRTDDIRVDIVGHGTTALWYRGNSTGGWDNMTALSSSAFQFAETKGTSTRFNTTSHYILELMILKTSTELGWSSNILNQTFAMRVCYFDAHAGGYGNQTWPASSNSTDATTYGAIPYNNTAIPETLNIGVVIGLSSVAVVAAVFLQRRSKASKLANKPSVLIE